MSRTILFLCPHAVAKSVMASALCARGAAAACIDLRTDAAGTEPEAVVRPNVAALMASEGIDVSAHRPRKVTAADLAGAWRVISLGCDVSAIAPAGVAIEYWNDVPAPSEDLAGARRIIGDHVDALLKSLAR